MVKMYATHFEGFETDKKKFILLELLICSCRKDW
jgi:hypothetical protein